MTNFHLNVTNDTLQVFLPDDMRSLRDLKELLRLFPPRDAQRDTYSIFGSKFVYTVIEDDSSDGNILSSSGIQRMSKLHKFVMGLEVGCNLMFYELFKTFSDITRRQCCIELFEK